MRFCLCAVITILLASAMPLPAQELARVPATASLRMPEFMIIEPGTVINKTESDGEHVRRVTLLVSANRAWRLEVRRTCAAACSPVRVEVSRDHGRAAHREEVVIEYSWRSSERPPKSEEFAYLLVGD